MDFADKKVAMSRVIVYSGENQCQFQTAEMEKLENSQSSIKYLHTVKYLQTNQKNWGLPTTPFKNISIKENHFGNIRVHIIHKIPLHYHMQFPWNFVCHLHNQKYNFKVVP